MIGGGFVGAEVASTALALGVRVTMLEALATPFERTLGPTLGRLLADRYRSHGVDLRVRTAPAGFRTDPAAASLGAAHRRERAPLRRRARRHRRRARRGARAGRDRGSADLRLRRRHGWAWPLDERGRRSRRRRTPDPRPAATTRPTGLLLVRPVRTAAPARRPRESRAPRSTSKEPPRPSSPATATPGPAWSRRSARTGPPRSRAYGAS